MAPDAVQTSEGIWPEAGTVFYTLVTGAAPTSYVAAGSGKFAFQISDFVPGTVRLKSSGAATITAGYETIGD